MSQNGHPKIVLFSGGTACRSINLALCRRPFHLTRVVPAWDSGGSSKVIRETFGVLSVGDIRQALMTMAYGEGCAGDVVKICNARLSDSNGSTDARTEFEYYANGRHPLLERMEPGLRSAILNYLRTFSSRIGDRFDFRNGSVGNFILTGAYLAHNNDINTAIFVFRKLCGITGNVWPSSNQNGIELTAILKNDRIIPQQHLITALSDEDARAGIREIDLSIAASDDIAVRANEAVIEAIEKADAIVFGPGSFYSSILPHLLIHGVVPAIARNRNALKILIGNILQCRETRGDNLSGLVGLFREVWSRNGGKGKRPLSHIVANRELFPFEKTIGSFPYLANGALDETSRKIRADVLIGEYEDAWQRGQHDGEAIADTLAGLLSRT